MSTSQYRVAGGLRGVYHIIGPSGMPLYRDENLYKGKPPLLTFTDEHEAQLYVERCNWTLEDEP